MPHDHHGHVHLDPEAGDARISWAIAVNMGLTLAQVVGGLLSGSLALIADALHNFSDAIALIIAFFARRIAFDFQHVIALGHALARIAVGHIDQVIEGLIVLRIGRCGLR